MPWIDGYTPNEYAAYKVEAGSPDVPPLELTTTFCVCDAESEMARVHYKAGCQNSHFYWDMEVLLGAGRDKVYAGNGPFILSRPWNGHPAGSIVLQTFEGIEDMCYTYLVGKH